LLLVGFVAWSQETPPNAPWVYTIRSEPVSLSWSAELEKPTSLASAVEPSPSATPIQETPLEPRQYTGQKISLDFKDADIKNVLRILADVGGLNLITTEEVKGLVTLRLIDLPWDQALDLILKTYSFEAVQDGNVLRISSAERIKRERDAVLAAKKLELEMEPLQVEYMTLNYAKAKEIAEKIKGILSKREGASVSVDERTNTVIVRDIEQTLADAHELVAKLDTQTPQVLIETHIVEASESFARNLGSIFTFRRGGATVTSSFEPGGKFDLLNLGGTLSFSQGKVGGLKDLSSVLGALEEDGKIRIVSRPRVVTLNNIPSTIESLTILRVRLPSTGTVIATGPGGSAGSQTVATEKIPIGIALTVTPQVSADGFVFLEIQVKSSTTSAQTTDNIPNEISRQANSRVLIRDGDTVVIGGILRDKRTSTRSGFPYLMDLPGLGWFFKRVIKEYDKEELMVFITPRILPEGAFPPPPETDPNSKPEKP
jgi:type IV pilus assembly protein PilQ